MASMPYESPFDARHSGAFGGARKPQAAPGGLGGFRPPTGGGGLLGALAALLLGFRGNQAQAPNVTASPSPTFPKPASPLASPIKPSVPRYGKPKDCKT